MSDKVSLYQAIKDNWTQLAVAAVIFSVLGGAFMEWRISANVAAALSAQDIGTDSKIVSMDDEIDANGAKATANATRIDGNERRVEQAFAALMGRPVPDDD